MTPGQDQGQDQGQARPAGSLFAAVIDVCDAYVTAQRSMLTGHRTTVGSAAVVAINAQLDQLAAALRHARQHHPDLTARPDPAGPAGLTHLFTTGPGVPMTSPLIIAAHTIDGVLRLDVAGEVDLMVADDLRDAIDKALTADRAVELIIDLGAVTFLDSSGISALLAGRVQALAQGSAYRVTNPRGMVHHVLTVTGVLDVLTGTAS